MTVAAGFTSAVVMSWGDKVVDGAPEFDAHQQSVAAARMQFGYNCDFVGVLPLRSDNALLVVNHEYTDENLMFPADTYTPARDQGDRNVQPRHVGGPDQAGQARRARGRS